MSKRDLIVVTFSGAHGTGKTTLLGDVQIRCVAKLGRKRVVTTPSVSSMLFHRIKAGKVKPPGGAVPESYDEIDELGLRQWFQETLPTSLCFDLEAASQGLSARRGVASPLLLLVDRWFADIYAYALVEAPDGAPAVAGKCRDGYSMAASHLEGAFRRVKILNVFVPLSASQFPTTGQEGKFRATCDRDTFEAACLDGWSTILPSRPTVTVSTPDRTGRVAEVLSAIEEASTSFRSEN